MKKTVLITGGAGGIGRAASEAFAGSGYQVMVNYRHSRAEAEALAAMLREEGHAAIAHRADITDRAQVERMVETCLERFGTVDVLINNAGISEQALFTDITEGAWDRMMDVHVKGMYHCCQCVLPHMLGRKAGRIINVSSVWGMVGASCEVHYSTAKAAVIGFTKALAKELGPSNILVNCVAPGIIETDMNTFLSEEEADALREATPLNRFGTAAEVAQCMLFLASGSADFITGQVLSPNGGFVI
ncbi:MAG: elongation factor P 5-aminopentanone reductase [Bacillota bacterium]